MFGELSRLEARGSTDPSESPPRLEPPVQLPIAPLVTVSESTPRPADGGVGPSEVEGRASGSGETEEVVGVTSWAKDIVDTCVGVWGRLEACPQARHYVMSADR